MTVEKLPSLSMRANQSTSRREHVSFDLEQKNELTNN
jgi:hypothetical protein